MMDTKASMFNHKRSIFSTNYFNFLAKMHYYIFFAQICLNNIFAVMFLRKTSAGCAKLTGCPFCRLLLLKRATHARNRLLANSRCFSREWRVFDVASLCAHLPFPLKHWLGKRLQSTTQWQEGGLIWDFRRFFMEMRSIYWKRRKIWCWNLCTFGIIRKWPSLEGKEKSWCRTNLSHF